MNALAQELNAMIKGENPAVYEMLSSLGKSMFFPKGILTQTAEANQKAHKFNATIGIATENGVPMHLGCLHEPLKAFEPKDLFNYAPASGNPKLRDAWKEKMYRENPNLKGSEVSSPVVTNALTHGLSIVADLFVDEGDMIVLPDQYWGNYRLTFAVRCGGEISAYNTFTEAGGFDVDALLAKVKECGTIKGKVVVLLNFPNNPSGYSITSEEAHKIADGLAVLAESGIKMVVVTDDAYFGLFYEDDVCKESIFGLLVGRSSNLLSIKLDGVTKEEFAWGFRVGFITFGSTGGAQSETFTALEKKVAGLIRGTISNCATPSQTFVLKALGDDRLEAQKAEKFQILKERALAVKSVLGSGKYDDEFESYPFNSGYFMCIKLKGVNSEELRVLLLDKYGVGTIASDSTDLRIAFSCIEKGDVEELFDIVRQGCLELK